MRYHQCSLLLAILAYAPLLHAQGQGCTSDANCPSGQWCDLGSNTCAAKLGFASRCPRATSCLSNICCWNDPNFYPNCPANPGSCAGCTRDTDCAPNGGPHVFCALLQSAPQCIPGSATVNSVCSKTANCAQGLYCSTSSTCQATKPKGASCSINDECGDNLYCALVSPGQFGTCSDAQGYGQACSAQTPCLSYLQCDVSGPIQTCKNLLSPTFSASSCPDDLSCGSSGYCLTSQFTVGFQSCAPVLSNGAFCTRPRQCASNVCSNGLCVGGNDCTNTVNCPGGQQCINRVCQPPLTLGSPCGADPECSTGFCRAPSPNPTNLLYCMQCDSATQSGCDATKYCNSINSISVCSNKLVNGQACTSGTECLGGLCTNGVCVGGCLTNADCGAGAYCSNYRCYPYQNKPDGSVCSQSSECASQFCFNGFCRTTCIPSFPVCPSGTFCQPNTAVPGVGGVCLPTGGQLPNGAACQFDSQCISNFCNNGICGYSCNAGYICPPGTTCNTASGRCQFGGNLPLGASCSSNVQCQSGLCWFGICTARCTFDSQCPQGYFCDPTTGTCTCATKPNGFPCTSSPQCQSGLCLNGVCTRRCVRSSDCNFNQVCDNGVCVNGQCGSQNACPIGYNCVSNRCVFAGLPDGSSCNQNSQCCSNLCVNWRCQKRCVMTTDCPAGYCCNPVSGLCEWLRKPLGAVCSFDSECLSGFCDPVTRLCSLPCTPGSCPFGWVCDINTRRCVLCRSPDGSRCVFDSDCSSGICNLGYCGNCRVVGCSVINYVCDQGSGRCIKNLLPNGWACSFGGDCRSGFCNNGVCGSPCVPNSCPFMHYCASGNCRSGCNSDAACGAGSYCLNYRCYYYGALANGLECEDDSECSSGSCTGGSCRSLSPLGGRCSNDDECKGQLVCDTSYIYASWGVCAISCAYRNGTASGGNASNSDYTCPPAYFCEFNSARMSQPLCIPTQTGLSEVFALKQEQLLSAAGQGMAAVTVLTTEQALQYEEQLTEMLGLV